MKNTSPWQIAFNRAVLDARAKARKELHELIEASMPKEIDSQIRYAMMNESRG